MKQRVFGVDAARGLALFGMFAVHVMPMFDGRADPTLTTHVFAGRSAAIFALLAGVSIAFITGRKVLRDGNEFRAKGAGLVVRAAVIAVIGLVVGLLSVNVDVILVYYGAAFVFALPLLRMRSRQLLITAALLALVSPVFTIMADLVMVETYDFSPNIGDLLNAPLGFVSGLLITGTYPVPVLLAYIAVGMAIGRADLTSPIVARKFVFIGCALAAAGWVVATVAMFTFGGIDGIDNTTRPGWSEDDIRSFAAWWREPLSASWWALASRAPHSYSTPDIVHTIGTSMLVLGTCLMLRRQRWVRTLLAPLTAAGRMPLTIYTTHLLVLFVLPAGLPPGFTLGLLVVTLGLFALGWSRISGQGPLEKLISELANRARRRVADSGGRKSLRSL